MSQSIDVWVHTAHSLFTMKTDFILCTSKAGSVWQHLFAKKHHHHSPCKTFVVIDFSRRKIWVIRMNRNGACVGVCSFVALCSSSCKFTHGSNNSNRNSSGSDSSWSSRRRTFGAKSYSYYKGGHCTAFSCILFMRRNQMFDIYFALWRGMTDSY